MGKSKPPPEPVMSFTLAASALRSLVAALRHATGVTEQVAERTIGDTQAPDDEKARLREWVAYIRARLPELYGDASAAQSQPARELT